MKFFFFFLFSILFSAENIYAERIGIPDFSDVVCIDLPAGVKVSEQSGDDSFHLKSDAVPVDFVLRIFGRGEYGSSHDALADVSRKLGLKSDISSCMWQGRKQALLIGSGKIFGDDVKAYGASFIVPENEKIVVIVGWSNLLNTDLAAPTITSLLDAVYINSQSYFSPGIVTEYAYPETENTVDVHVSIGGKDIKSTLNACDVDASEYLIEREYSILKLYAKRTDWKDALVRYYRMIFKDSCKRLCFFANDVFVGLAESCIDETDYAQRILNWVQSFDYERNTKSSDFTSLPAAVLGKGSDCDSRSMLLAVMLQGINEDAVVFVSAVHSHAIAGYRSKHPGFSFMADNKMYLTGETTVKNLTWGKIVQGQENPEDWIPVLLP